MVNENNNINLIAKENHKKVEEVREIENEIPSYEEFMKKYEVDSKVNYDDLSSENVGTVKGYGPVHEGYHWTERDIKETKEMFRRMDEREEKERRGFCSKDGCRESKVNGDKRFCSKHRKEEDEEWGIKTALHSATLIVTSAICPPLGAGLAVTTGVIGTGMYVAGKASNDKDLTESGKMLLGPAVGKAVAGNKIGESGIEITKVFGWL